MSESLVIKGVSATGEPIQATFLPENGLRLVSYKVGSKDRIEEGVLVAPKRSSPILEGGWTITADEESFKAEKEGIHCKGAITSRGLELSFSIVAETDALIGMGLRFPLSKGKNRLTADVQPEYIVNGDLRPLPVEWSYTHEGKLSLDLTKPYSCAFRPLLNPLGGNIKVETEESSYSLTYRSHCAENSWMLETSQGESSVVLTPLSSQNPWYPNLTVSSLALSLSD